MAAYSEINALVEKIQKDGDLESLSKLIKIYRPLIRSSINRCIRLEPRLKEYADDLNADVFMIAKKVVNKYDPSKSNFSHYLSIRLDAEILKMGRVYYLKHKDYEIDDAEIPLESFQFDPFEAIRTRIVIQNALRKLQPKEQEAIQLCFYEEYTHQEAADKMNLSRPYLHKLLTRGLAKMRSIIEDKEIDWDF